MKNVMLTLALLPALSLATAAFAQAPAERQDVSWADLALGERVEITFRSGGTILGKLVAPASRTAAIDFSKETSLTLDVSEAGVDGTLTVSKKDVKALRRLRVEQPKSISEMAAPRPKVVAPPAPEKPKAPAPVTEAPPSPETDEEREARLRKEAEERRKIEELKQAVAFYEKFPPPFWGPDRHTMIVQKKARGQAWSAAETEFEKDYPRLWEKGRAASAPKKD
jgi:hypothetical protein